MNSVRRDKDENGNGVYTISGKLVHAVLVSIVGAIITIGGYMIAWAINDSGWKTSMVERQHSHTLRIISIENDIRVGILPLARERLDNLDRRVQRLEEKK